MAFILGHISMVLPPLFISFSSRVVYLELESTVLCPVVFFRKIPLEGMIVSSGLRSTEFVFIYFYDVRACL